MLYYKWLLKNAPHLPSSSSSSSIISYPPSLYGVFPKDKQENKMNSDDNDCWGVRAQESYQEVIRKYQLTLFEINVWRE